MKKIILFVLLIGCSSFVYAAESQSSTKNDANPACSKKLSEQSCNQAYLGAICHRGSVEGVCEANGKNNSPVCSCKVKSEIIPLAKTSGTNTPATNSSLKCKDSNVYGDYAAGGGCNQYGCYPPGGSCNDYGCSMKGECSSSGCPQKIETYYCNRPVEE